MTEETKKKISLAKKGKPSSSSTKFMKGLAPWNKGTKGLMKSNKTSFKKGEHRSSETEFKKGHKPEPFSEQRRRNMGDAHRGEKCWNWKGGIKGLNMQIRNSFKTRLWRSDVFQRDKYTCQFCGVIGGILNVDHYPKTFSSIMKEYQIKNIDEAYDCEELWNINNGRTLCKPCHLKTETWGTRKKHEKNN